MKSRDTDTVTLGHEDVDLSAVEQIFDASQTRAVGAALLLLMDWVAKPAWRGRKLDDILEALEQAMETKVSYTRVG